MITAEQRAHWKAFGFLVLRGLFDPKETEALRKAAVEVVEQQGGAQAFTRDPGWGMGTFLERHPLLANWVDDDRIYEIPQAMLGPDYVLQHTGGAIWRGDTLWHGGLGSEERPSPPFETAKIAMYFDSLKKESGCLRVIPGSHRRPYADRLHLLMSEDKDPTHEAFGLQGPDVPCVALESEPGDVIVFSEPTYHSSFGSNIGASSDLHRILCQPDHGGTPRLLPGGPRPVQMVLSPVRVVHQQRPAQDSPHGVPSGRAGIRSPKGVGGPGWPRRAKFGRLTEGRRQREGLRC